MLKGDSIVSVIAVISVLSITTSSVLMTQKQQHTTFAQLTGQEFVNSSIEKASIQEFPVPLGSRPHDVAPMPNGTLVWYTAQGSGELGRLDPTTGETHHIALGQGSAPHGVIIGPDGVPWITDGGLNAIVRVDPLTEEVKVYPLPANSGYGNLNTATFDHNGTLWFTGQSGIYGRLDPQVGKIEVFQAPRGPGPYGISTTPNGTVYYSSLAGSYIARIDLESRNRQRIGASYSRPRSTKSLA